MLLPVETLAKPMRVGVHDESAALLALLRQVRLLAVSLPLALRATALAAEYRLGSVDAIHLATAVEAGADVLFTNNVRDFGDVHVDRLSIEFPASEA